MRFIIADGPAIGVDAVGRRSAWRVRPCAPPSSCSASPACPSCGPRGSRGTVDGAAPLRRSLRVRHFAPQFGLDPHRLARRLFGKREAAAVICARAASASPSPPADLVRIPRADVAGVGEPVVRLERDAERGERTLFGRHVADHHDVVARVALDLPPVAARPERQRLSMRFETMPSAPPSMACRNTFAPSPSIHEATRMRWPSACSSRSASRVFRSRIGRSVSDRHPAKADRTQRR